MGDVKKKPILFCEDGFTIIEVLVAATILAIVLGAFYGLFLGTMQVWRTSEERVDVQQRVRYAVLSVVKEIREASRVVDQKVYMEPHWYEAGTNNLFLEKPGGKVVVFYLLKNSNLLRRAVLVGGCLEGNNEVAHGISELKLEYNNPNLEKSTIVTISIKASDGSYGLRTKAYLRLLRIND